LNGLKPDQKEAVAGSGLPEKHKCSPVNTKLREEDTDNGLEEVAEVLEKVDKRRLGNQLW
tara:strand:- start:1686 stop:1865 length:180 start_codon:yes stop_codon:yes gene_type:complete